MKITQRRLKQIIKEEIETALDEGQWQDNLDADAKCAKKYKRNTPEYEDCLTKEGIPLEEGGCGDHAAPEVMMADDEPVHSDNPLDALARIIASLMEQKGGPCQPGQTWEGDEMGHGKCVDLNEADDEKDEEYVDPKVDPYERALEAPLQEKEDDNWIQDAEKDIERRGTEGVCTGKNFGSEKCPPGSKRYNLAKTFRKMAKDRKK